MSGQSDSLLPQKRGPKWRTRRPHPLIENKVIEARLRGLNRYEIVGLLKPKLKKFCPSASGVYNIFKPHNLNRLTKKMQTSKCRIIKQKAAELGHINCHYRQKGILRNDNRRFYLVAVIDSCTRLAFAAIIPDLRALE